MGIYSQDIGMEVDIEKCILFITKSAKREPEEGIELQKQESIRLLGERRKNYRLQKKIWDNF